MWHRIGTGSPTHGAVLERDGGSQTIHKQSNGEQVDKTRKTFRLVANKSGKPYHYHRP